MKLKDADETAGEWSPGNQGGPILVTGAAGRTGAVGRTVVSLLLDRGLHVRAMVRREDERAAALRAQGAEVVVGDLLEPEDVYRAASGSRRVYFGMSASFWIPRGNGDHGGGRT